MVSYTTVSPLPAAEAAGGLFSVALSRGSPRVAVGHHPALWSPDVPRQGRGPDATAWPTHPRTSIGLVCRVLPTRRRRAAPAASDHAPEREERDVVVAVGVGDGLREVVQHVVEVGVVVDLPEEVVGGGAQAL